FMAVADVNGDGLDDAFLGGAKDQPGKLLIQQPDGRFVSTNETLFAQDRVSEDLGAVFFDADGDGHPDLYVVSGGSEFSANAPALQDRLYLNDGRGHFRKATGSLPNESSSGSRVVVGEWMPITVFHNAGGGKLVRVTTPGLEQSQGWWNRIVAGDFTGHGRVDFIVGNLGLNTRLRASASEPVTMYVKDFDGNGSVEQIVTCYNEGVSYPITMRDDLIRALPYLKARYLNYKNYARQTVTDIFS